MSRVSRHAAFLAPALILALGLVAGCNFFRPEDPPAATDPPPEANYRQVNNTFQTIVAAIVDKRALSLPVYIGAFSDSTVVALPGYHHIFWPEDVATYVQGGGTAPADWGVKEEREFFATYRKNLLVINGGSYEAQFQNDPFNADREEGSEYLAHRWYQILARDQESGQVTEVIAQGYADVTLRQTPGGDWLITRWEDRPDPEPNPYNLPQPTWGQRRLESR